MQKNHFKRHSQKISAYDTDNTHLTSRGEIRNNSLLTSGFSSKENEAGKVCLKLSNPTMRSRFFATSGEGFVTHFNFSSEISLKKRNYMPVLPFTFQKNYENSPFYESTKKISNISFEFMLISN